MHPWLEPYYQQFINALNQGRMPHSIIIAGHKGLGVNELAFSIAKYYLCLERTQDGPCNHCPSCLNFERFHHSDLKIAYPCTSEEMSNKLDFTHDSSYLLYPQDESTINTKKILRVDTLRSVNEFLSESAMGGGGKAVIISDAHTMNANAANAILKTFEEPYKNSLIIMVCQSLELLLPTILSRAQKIVIKEIDIKLALDYLLDKDKQNFAHFTRPLASYEDEVQDKTKDSESKIEIYQEAITKERALIALELNSYAPLSAMRMLLKGEDVLALNVIFALKQALNSNQDESNLVIEALQKLNKGLQIRLLSVLILEILKFKAHTPLEQLPLLNYSKAQELYRLQAKHLFRAYKALLYLDDSSLLIPSKAPLALIRAWLKAFKGQPKI